MLQSRLTFWGKWTRFGFFLINLCVILGLIMFAKNKTSLAELFFFILSLILAFIMSLVVVMKTRNITIANDKISYTNWLTGKARNYHFKDLEGYITIVKPIGIVYKEHESIILVNKNKRIGEISAFYYANYNELKGGLKKLKYLRQESNDDYQSIKHNLNELIK